MTIDYPAAAQAGQLRALWKEAFGDSDEFLDIFFGTAFSPTRCRVVTVDDRVAAALYWFDCKCDGADFAYLYAVATGQDYRRRGLCHALMADTHKLLAERGYAGAILVPGAQALTHLYETMGYRACTTVTEFTCTPGETGTELVPISPEHYARRRAAMLPEGGVIQEKENMAFLAAMAQFYQGSDFLLAAAWEGETLRGLELLGNPAAAPGILAALHVPSGSFRTPGPGRDFAMFLPLAPDAPTPAWFGFAFD